MDNRYNYFADEETNEVVRQVGEVKDASRSALLKWREKMTEQVVTDILETLAKLDTKLDASASEEEYQWRASAVLKFLINDFVSGLLYAQEKLG